MNGTTKAEVIVVDAHADRQNSDSVAEFMANVDEAIAESSNVAFDCEGVDLSRLGSVEIVSIAFHGKPIFLVDFQGLGRDTPLLQSVKKLLESNQVNKIIHDCRMDCDALYHLHGISVVNVHDTSSFHKVNSGSDLNKSLNDVLSYNDLLVNVIRDSGVYKTNPRFWAQRPLTSTMQMWASEDVARLHLLADSQLTQCRNESRAETQSSKNAKWVVESKVKIVNCHIPLGRFIGRRGANIQSVQARTDTLVYSKEGSSFMVFYKTEDSLKKVERAMGHHEY